MHARSDGSDGRVLEAGLAHSGRAVRADPGECRACEERAWPQERRERCDLACGPDGAWPDPVKLRAATSDPGLARSDPDAEAIDARDCAARTTHPSSSRGVEHQTVFGDHGNSW